MRKLPIRGADRAFAGQVRANPARAPEMRVIEARLPGERGRTESRDVRRQIADLLRVTVSATFAAIDHASPLLARSQGQGVFGRHAPCLLFENAARPHTAEHDR